MKLDVPMKLMLTAMITPLLGITVLLIYYIVPWTPLIIHDVIITTPVVKAGEIVHYDVKFNKTQDVACSVKRQLSNSYIVNYEELNPPRKNLGEQVTHNILHVPLSVDSGDRWQIISTWECEKPFKPLFVVTKKSPLFTVIK